MRQSPSGFPSASLLAGMNSCAAVVMLSDPMRQNPMSDHGDQVAMVADEDTLRDMPDAPPAQLPEGNDDDDHDDDDDDDDDDDAVAPAAAPDAAGEAAGPALPQRDCTASCSGACCGGCGAGCSADGVMDGGDTAVRGMVDA